MLSMVLCVVLCVLWFVVVLVFLFLWVLNDMVLCNAHPASLALHPPHIFRRDSTTTSNPRSQSMQANIESEAGLCMACQASTG